MALPASLDNTTQPAGDAPALGENRDAIAEGNKHLRNIPPGSIQASVLLVEDNPVNRKLGTAILEKCGCSVTEAENGKYALEALDAQDFDCVFMDVQMPEMDGFEATRLIRADGRWNNLPIVAMTAHAMRGDRERCIAAGMDDYLTKPVSMDAVAAMIAKWAMPRVP